MTVKLIAPIAMEEGLRFAIREGGRTVGAGVVAKSSSNRAGCAGAPGNRGALVSLLQGYSSIGRASVSKTEGWGSIPSAPATR